MTCDKYGTLDNELKDDMLEGSAVLVLHQEEDEVSVAVGVRLRAGRDPGRVQDPLVAAYVVEEVNVAFVQDRDFLSLEIGFRSVNVLQIGPRFQY